MYSWSIHRELIGPNTPLFGVLELFSHLRPLWPQNKTFIIYWGTLGTLSSLGLWAVYILKWLFPLGFPWNSVFKLNIPTVLCKIFEYDRIHSKSFFFFSIFTHELYECTNFGHSADTLRTLRPFMKCAGIPVLYSPVSYVIGDQSICSDSKATLIPDSPPAIREYFTPFLI